MKYLHPLLLSLLLGACARNEDPLLHGYVEAEPVRLAAPVAGRLLRLDAERGQAVQTGQALFALDQENEAAAVAEARSRLSQAQAQSADLDSGKRPDELAVIAAEQRVAQAALRQSTADLQRQQQLAGQGFVAKAALDAFLARRDADAARVAELDAQLRSARLAGREGARRAAQAASDAAQAALAQRQWSLNQKLVVSPLAARVEDRYYRVGEWVPAGAPVLSLLAPGAVKARFFAPEPLLTRLAPGSKVTLSCDGCGASMPAVVSFVARDAEFTPPLIYSKENRAKLVWLVEAQPEAKDAARLRPGQPLDVALP